MNNKMLHVFNFMWLGGVPCFIRNMMQIYPQFHHVCTYLNEKSSFGGEDYDMLQDWELVFGADCGFIHDGILRKSLIDEVDPAIVVLHGISGNRLEGNWPYHWLRERPTMFVHHMNSRPHLSVDFDLFVSNYLFQMYQDTKNRMTKWVICPPAIDTTELAKIERPRLRKDMDKLVIGKLCSDWNSKKYPRSILDTFRALNEKYGNLEFRVVGGAKHWSNHGIPNLKTPAVNETSVRDFLAGLDIFFYINEKSLPETWGRSVTEAMAAGLPVVTDDFGGTAEQIENGVDGFTVGGEYVGYLSDLVNNPAMRHKVGMAARLKAVGEFGLDRLKRETVDFVLSAAMGVV